MGCLGFFIYRFNAVFNVSKTRALVVAILCFIAGCITIPIGAAFASDATGGFASVYVFIWSLIYGGIWFFKHRRDQRIIERAKAQSAQPAAQIIPDMTTPGSNRLFVPKQFDRP